LKGDQIWSNFRRLDDFQPEAIHWHFQKFWPTLVWQNLVPFLEAIVGYFTNTSGHLTRVALNFAKLE
jgi:hypothetical protein